MFKKISELINFLKALLVFIDFYKDGFRISSNMHDNHVTESKGHWGFYRLHHKMMFGLYDIDLTTNERGHNYFHARGDDCRIDWQNPGPSFVKAVRNRK